MQKTVAFALMRAHKSEISKRNTDIYIKQQQNLWYKIFITNLCLWHK